MPKEKQATKLIPKLYKDNMENLGLFFFVRGELEIFPAMKLDQAIRNYLRFCKIEDWDIESARSTYTRMQTDYIDLCYHKKFG